MEHQTPQEVRLKIAGALSSAQVGVLQEEGDRALERAERLALDLAEVKSIDAAGLALLLKWAGPALELHRVPPFIATLLYQQGLDVREPGRTCHPITSHHSRKPT